MCGINSKRGGRYSGRNSRHGVIRIKRGLSLCLLLLVLVLPLHSALTESETQELQSILQSLSLDFQRMKTSINDLQTSALSLGQDLSQSKATMTSLGSRMQNLWNSQTIQEQILNEQGRTLVKQEQQLAEVSILPSKFQQLQIDYSENQVQLTAALNGLQNSLSAMDRRAELFKILAISGVTIGIAGVALSAFLLFTR